MRCGTGNSQSRFFRAEGTGSRLELPNVTSVTGGANYSNRMFIEAKSGGVIDLSQVTEIVDPPLVTLDTAASTSRPTGPAAW